MDLDTISVFVKVVQAGSFSQAARLLGVGASDPREIRAVQMPSHFFHPHAGVAFLHVADILGDELQKERLLLLVQLRCRYACIVQHQVVFVGLAPGLCSLRPDTCSWRARRVARLELRGSRNAEVADRQSGGTARRRGCELGCTIADERSGCARGRFWPNLLCQRRSQSRARPAARRLR
jgi:hypothetical protein